MLSTLDKSRWENLRTGIDPGSVPVLPRRPHSSLTCIILLMAGGGRRALKLARRSEFPDAVSGSLPSCPNSAGCHCCWMTVTPSTSVTHKATSAPEQVAVKVAALTCFAFIYRGLFLLNQAKSDGNLRLKDSSAPSGGKNKNRKKTENRKPDGRRQGTLVICRPCPRNLNRGSFSRHSIYIFSCFELSLGLLEAHQYTLQPVGQHRCAADSSLAGNKCVLWNGGWYWSPTRGGFQCGSRVDLYYASKPRNRRITERSC